MNVEVQMETFTEVAIKSLKSEPHTIPDNWKSVKDYIDKFESKR